MCGSFLFFSDLQLHETRADLSHRREQVVITRKWGLESHTHVCPGINISVPEAKIVDTGWDSQTLGRKPVGE